MEQNVQEEVRPFYYVRPLSFRGGLNENAQSGYHYIEDGMMCGFANNAFRYSIRLSQIGNNVGAILRIDALPVSMTTGGWPLWLLQALAPGILLGYSASRVDIKEKPPEHDHLLVTFSFYYPSSSLQELQREAQRVMEELTRALFNLEMRLVR